MQISLHRAKEKDSVTVDGMSPALSDWLNSVPAGEKVIAEIKVQKGPLYHLGSVKVIDPKTNMPVALTQAQQQAFGLKTGQDAVAQDVLGSGGNLLDVWREEGHALARVDKPRAYLQPQTHTLDIVYPASAGPVLNIGTIDVDGLKRVHEKFVRRRLTVQEGELYQPSKIEAARQDLSSLGVFSNVGVKDGSTKPVNGTMPLDFTFKEAKRRSVGQKPGIQQTSGHVWVRRGPTIIFSAMPSG